MRRGGREAGIVPRMVPAGKVPHSFAVTVQSEALEKHDVQIGAGILGAWEGVGRQGGSAEALCSCS